MDAPPNLCQAMEHVAGRAETLAKDKAKDPPPLFRKRKTESIYTKVYSSDGKEAREKCAQQCEVRQTAISKLGDKEYKKLLQEVDLMTHTAVDINKLVDKRVNEIQECMEAERQKEEASQRPVTRSQAGTSTEMTAERELIPQVRSPRKRGKEDDHKETGGKKPKRTEPKDTAEKTPKTSERKETGGKKPKTPKAHNTSMTKTTNWI